MEDFGSSAWLIIWTDGPHVTGNGMPMKRDMGLIREILFKIESSEEPFLQFDDIEARHVAILVDAGLVSGTTQGYDGGGILIATVDRLTWAGHDFLDAMRDDTIWKKAQDSILKPIGGVAFDVLLAWLKQQMCQRLGLPGSD